MSDYDALPVTPLTTSEIISALEDVRIAVGERIWDDRYDRIYSDLEIAEMEFYQERIMATIEQLQREGKP